MRGDIILSQEEAHRARVFGEVTKGTMTLKEAAAVLRISYRHTRRVHVRYLEEGVAGLAHRRRGEPARNAIDPDLRSCILQLHEQDYGNFNDTHFTEMLEEHNGISVSRETVRSILRSAGKPPKRKRRPRKHRSRRPRKPRTGIMMQWDGSPHHWFGPDRPPCCLMSAVDDADSRLLGAVFVPAESAVGYLRLLDIVVRRHGKPLSVYQDRHSILRRSDDHWSIEEEIAGVRFPTHVGRVLDELGIAAIPAYSPQAKGRIERSFGVLQDRLIAELEFHGITSSHDANRWLKEVFIDRYNKRFAKTPEQKGSAFSRVSKRDRHLKIAFGYEATVANDNCVRLGGLIIDIPPGRPRRSYAKAKVLIRQHLDGAWSVWYQGNRIATHPPTELRDPIRTWRRRRKGDPKGAKHMIQVYMASRPAP
ncbi:ISNCY family transposase [bacterium]|nr:ISNCY family transposase [bacterium]